MSKSIKIRREDGREEQREIYQLTIKAAGGLSVTQLETPEALSADQMAKLKAVFGAWQPEVALSLRKAYFEPVVTGPDGKPLLRPDGTPYTAEVDLFLQRDEQGWYPNFVNGEIEFHGATQEESVAAAAALS